MGFGNIGKRHLEALLKLPYYKEIFIHDIDKSKLENFDVKSTEIKIGVSLYNLVDNLTIDYCIISSLSRKRLSIIKEILSITEVKTFILEKVLFSCVSDYTNISILLQRTNSEVFINCNRRIMASYIDLKNRLHKENILNFEVQGSNWNMASNIIHFLDTLSFFIDDKINEVTLNGDYITDLIESKHYGYIEFLGKINGSINHIIFSASSTNEQFDLTIKINTNLNTYLINETLNMLIIENNAHNSVIEERFNIEFVSSLTNKFITSHANGNPTLTDYDTSVKIHLPLIEMVINQQKRFLGSDLKDEALIT